MNTPGHLIVGAAAFAKPGAWRVTLAALLGAAAPDLSVIILVWWAENVQGHTPQHIFNTLYFSDGWQRVFAIDNSIPLWGAAFVGTLAIGHAVGRAFFGAGLLHTVADFLLHNDDGRSHLWPFTRWKFESPVSYWDSAHYGSYAAAGLFLLSAALVAILVRRFESWPMRILFGLLLLAEGYFAYVWLAFF